MQMAVRAAQIPVSSMRIDRVIKLILPFALIIVFLLTLSGAIQFHQSRSPWTIGDWLINYQDGFVRRGIFGEAVLRLARLLGANPGAIVAGIQCVLYAIFLLFSWLLLRRQKSLIPFLFLLVSPAIFLFQIHDPQGGYRKEILFFALMSFMVWLARRADKIVFERVFYGVLLIYPVLILSHEMLAIWLPYLLIVYLYKLRLTRRRVFVLLGGVSLSVLAFALSMVYSGDAHSAAAINLSLQQYGYFDPFGAIAFLKVDAYKALTSTWTTALRGEYFIYYPQTLILCLLAFIPVRQNLATVLATPWAKPLVLVSGIGTVLISLVGIDWGRFIYASIMPLFLLTLLVDRAQGAVSYSGKTIGLTGGLLILYASSWYVRHATEAFPYRWPF